MKTSIKPYLYTTASLLTVVGVLLSPVLASAADATTSTTVTATIGSTISMSSSGAVALSVTPVTGGSQSSASDTVSVSTNHAAGYTLKLANGDATTSLAKGSDTIAAHTGTLAAPTALANNAWGYAVGGAGSFDATYTALNNAATSTSKWAGVPSSSAPHTIKSTSSTASGDVTTFWYSVKADPTKPNGAYSDSVTYTATTN